MLQMIVLRVACQMRKHLGTAFGSLVRRGSKLFRSFYMYVRFEVQLLHVCTF